LITSIPISKAKSPFKLDSYSSGTNRPYLQLDADYQIKINTRSTNSNQDVWF